MNEVEKLRNLAYRPPLLTRIKSIFIKKKKEEITLEQIDQLIERRLESLKKSFEEKKKSEEIDLRNVWKYVDKVAKTKYGVDGAHMIQKTAWHFLLTTGGLPATETLIDKAEKIVTRLENITSKVDSITGRASPFKELEELKKEVETVVDFKRTMQSIEPQKELTAEDIAQMVEAGMELINTIRGKKVESAIIVEQYPPSDQEYTGEGM